MLLGSFEWGIKTGGRLSTFDKFNLLLKATGMLLKDAFRQVPTPAEFDISTIQLPDSKIVKQTLEYIEDVHQTPLKNHCLRTFLIGAYFGSVEQIKYDQEIFAISALLHDVGLEDQFCCLHKGINCFAVEGAKVAGDFLRHIEFNEEKVKIVENSISLHINLKIDDPYTEAYLVNKGSGADTIGFYRSEIHDQTALQIMDRYPRLGFNEIVHKMLKHQSKIRPNSRMALLYSAGFGGKLKKNKFDKDLY